VHTISDYIRKVFIGFLIPFLLVTCELSADPKNTDKSAINGEWKFNLKKSSLANMPVPQQATLLVSVHGSKLMWRESGVREDGTRYDYKFDGFIDGKPYPLHGASRVTISFQRKNGALVGKWKGKGKRISIAKVSEDGTLLTVENVSTVYNMVGNWTSAWDKIPGPSGEAPKTGFAAREQK
jgi:hypothetical protein